MEPFVEDDVNVVKLSFFCWDCNKGVTQFILGQRIMIMLTGIMIVVTTIMIVITILMSSPESRPWPPQS